MKIRLTRLVPYFFVCTLLTACQREILFLGDEEGEVEHDSVFLSAISLSGYDTLDPNGLPWDDTFSFLFDSIDYRFPDVFFNIGQYDSTFPLNFHQPSHFLNVTPDTLPVTYYLNPGLYVPGYYYPFYLRVYDFELDTPVVDSAFMDSVLFVLGPDTVMPDKYPRYVTGVGANGAVVTLSLLWK